MAKFLIGMHGGFDAQKFKRDFRPGFHGFEACVFPGRQEAEELVGIVKEYGLEFGVHYPFIIKKNSPCRDPLFLALEEEEREQAFVDFETEAAYASEKGAEYILAHFPKPVLVNKSLNQNYWRFNGKKEWMFVEDYPAELLKDNLEAMFERLSHISGKYGIQIVLENDAIPALFSESNILPDLLERHDRIKVCLDIGRLHLQQQIDTSFNAFKFIEMLSQYTYSIHLWNTNPSQNLTGGHYPVLPGLMPSDGWADISRFIKAIRRHDRDIRVLYEHRSDLVSDSELNECYRWVEELFGD